MLKLLSFNPYARRNLIEADKCKMGDFAREKTEYVAVTCKLSRFARDKQSNK